MRTVLSSILAAALGAAAPLADASRAVGVARTIPAVAGAVAAVLLLLALAVSGRRRRLAGRIGIGLLAVAGACGTLRLVGPGLGEAAVTTAPAGDLAGSVVADLLGGWWIAALVALIPGVVLLAVGRRG